jgi:hypothetical protein
MGGQLAERRQGSRGVKNVREATLLNKVKERKTGASPLQVKKSDTYSL